VTQSLREPVRSEEDQEAIEQIRSQAGGTGFRLRTAANQNFWILNNLKRRCIMLYTILGVLLVLWLLGFSMHVGGGLIHALLVIAVVVFLVNFISGRRSMA
jgi:VIT1/CCC1 family predicted Fe2+/Mn2+ transporter